MSPFDENSLIIIYENNAYDIDLTDTYKTFDFFKVIDSLVDERVRVLRKQAREKVEERRINEEARKERYRVFNEYMEREKQTKAAEEQAKKAKKETEELAERAREEALKLNLAETYYAWKKECDTRFAGHHPMTVFPHVPRKVCMCNDVSCSIQKKEEGSAMTCRHDLEKLLRASDFYSLGWLKKESLVWHPDRFGQKCDPDYRAVLCKKATHMFAIFGTLIDEEKNRRTTI